MGILTRRQGDTYVITSDRTSDATPSKQAPRRLSDAYQVWTGASWSTNTADGISFSSLDDADEYVRANFGKVTS
jgi:hypothetical protein